MVVFGTVPHDARSVRKIMNDEAQHVILSEVSPTEGRANGVEGSLVIKEILRLRKSPRPPGGHGDLLRSE